MVRQLQLCDSIPPSPLLHSVVLISIRKERSGKVCGQAALCTARLEACDVCGFLYVSATL
jgi:hypothetical protein